MKKYVFAGLILTAIAMSSCTSYRYTSRSNVIHNTNISTTGIIADIKTDFTKRVSEQSFACRSEETAKECALYNAIVNNKIDIVVDPIYKVQRRGSKYIAYVTGFAGYYVNPRYATEEGEQNGKKEDDNQCSYHSDDNSIVIYHKCGSEIEKKHKDTKVIEHHTPAVSPAASSSRMLPTTYTTPSTQTTTTKVVTKPAKKVMVTKGEPKNSEAKQKTTKKTIRVTKPTQK